MMRKSIDICGKERIMFFSLVGISFIMILAYNILTPWMSDDLLFEPAQYSTVQMFFSKQIDNYMNWNGRFILQSIMTVFYLLPKWVFNLFNSICFIYTSLLIYWNIGARKRWDSLLYLLIQLLLWNFSVDFDQTVLWVGGACNYLWGVMIILTFITLYRFLLNKQRREEKVSGKMAVLLVLSAFLAGWGNENTSGGAILIVLLFTLAYLWEKKRIEKWMATGLISALAGFVFLLLAPGNEGRGAVLRESESYTGVAALISRGLKVFKAIDEHLLIYTVVICLLGVYFYYEKKKLTEFLPEAIFTLASLATAAVLIFTPEPMARAYYGANIYMLIGAVMMVWKLKEGDRPLYALKVGGILAGALTFIFVYVEEGANLTRIMREVKEREDYIVHQVEMGERDLVLPMLRPQFETPYSFLYENDLSLDEEFWINEVFCIAYGLNSVTVMTRDDWDVYRGIEE